jgi:hypothetical protein
MKRPQVTTHSIKWFLNAVALILIILLGVKAIVDGCGLWDALSYHMPFAARLWGIVPADQFILNLFWESWYEGIALFGQFLQGFFWYITGRPESTNLVAYFSLLIFIYFLKCYFKIPLFLSTIALLAIPLVQVHATASYVDLPGNIGMSVLILMTYRLYLNPAKFDRQDMLVLFLGAACATNIRIKLVPLVFLILSFAIFKIIRNSIQNNKDSDIKKSNLRAKLLIISTALIIIFAPPIKNTLIYGNPFYPVAIKIGKYELASTRKMLSDKTIVGQKTTRIERWLYSIFEIIPRPFFRGNWNHDSNAGGPENRKGGFFGAYVLINLLFLGYLFLKVRSKETKLALFLMIIISIFTMIYPSSGRLRYYMYWMIVLVSLNLFLGMHFFRERKLPAFINDASMGLAAGLPLIIVIFSSNAKFIVPNFFSFNDVVEKRVQKDLLQNLQRKEAKCMPRDLSPNHFLYTAKFHPPLNYSIFQCEIKPNNMKVIPHTRITKSR